MQLIVFSGLKKNPTRMKKKVEVRNCLPPGEDMNALFGYASDHFKMDASLFPLYYFRKERIESLPIVEVLS